MATVTTIRPYDGWFKVFADGEEIGFESSLADAQWIAQNARDTDHWLDSLRADALRPEPVPAHGFDYLDAPEDNGFWHLMTGGRKRSISAAA